MNPETWKRFLTGSATELEALQIEAILANDGPEPSSSVPESVTLPSEASGCTTSHRTTELEDYDSDRLANDAPDSLLDTLRELGQVDTPQVISGAGELVQQIQETLTRNSVEPIDLQRALSPPVEEDEIGRIDRYRVIELLAQGGMGMVFKAIDADLGRMVCIKVLNPAMGSDAESKARFAREARAAAKLRNTRIATVFDVGLHLGLPYLVMQLLDGESLRTKLSQCDRLSPQQAIHYLIQIAEGLSYAHRLGFLHRDIKPENIWVTPEDDVKLLDFGLAFEINQTTNLTHTGSIIGTPAYMSPEQVNGNALDERSDLFSVGTVFHEMLTGQAPFAQDKIFSTMMSVVNDPWQTDATIPAQVQPVLESLLQKDPDHRIGSATELIDRLQPHRQPLAQELETASERSGSEAASKSDLSRSWFQTLVWGSSWAVAGASLLLLGVFISQLNDKGTLVIESDPAIKLEVADEVIDVHDPETDKRFKITIGETPLPSGVYQLQMLDASGELQLTSSIITIRRGEKQIVRIELKPSSSRDAEAPAGNESPAATTPIAGENLAQKFKPASKPDLDRKSKTLATPALAELPTLTAKELVQKLYDFDTDFLIRNSLVSRDGQQGAARDWTLESPYPEASIDSIKPNADGSRLAITHKNGHVVRISSIDGETTHLIPVQHGVRGIQWSPDPDILAIFSSSKLQRRVSFWKIVGSHLELIDSVESDAYQVGWSFDGLLVALQGVREIRFLDLRERILYTLPKIAITGSIGPAPWSIDKNLLATCDKKGAKIWSLAEKKLTYEFQDAREVRFLPNQNQIAARTHFGWEIWDLATMHRERLIKIAPEWTRSEPNFDFTKIVAITKGQEFVVRDFELGQETRVPLPKWPSFGGPYQVIEWSRDGSRFTLNNRHGIPYRSRALDNEFEPKDASSDQSRPLIQPLPLKVRAPLGLPLNSPLNQACQVAGQGVLTTTMAGDGKFRLTFYPMQSEKTEPVVLEDLLFSLLTEFKASPDGKWLAVAKQTGTSESSDSSSQSSGAEASEAMAKTRIDLYSLRDGTLSRTISSTGSLISFDWNGDSSRLVVSTLRANLETDKNQSATFRKAFFDKVFKRRDSNQDGTWTVDEPTRYDQYLSQRYSRPYRREQLGNRAALAGRKRLAIELIDVENGNRQEIPAVVEPVGVEPDAFLLPTCRETYYGCQPVVHQNVVAVVMFDAVDLLRSNEGGNRSTNTAILFFDTKTGKLTRIIGKDSFNQWPSKIALSDSLLVAHIPTLRNLLAYDLNHDSSPVAIKAPKQLRKLSIHKSEKFLIVNDQQGGAELMSITKPPKLSLVVSQRFSDTRGLGGHPSFDDQVGFTSDKQAKFYNLKTRQYQVLDGLEDDALQVLPFGHDRWLVVTNQRAVELDHELKTIRTHLVTAPSQLLKPGHSQFDQTVSAAGKLKHADRSSDLWEIRRVENRYENRPRNQMP